MEKKPLLTESEYQFLYDLLIPIANRYDLHFSIKPHIFDFIEASDEEFKKYNVRHCDFLLYDKATTYPVMAIELDGDSHKGDKKRNRDISVDEIYAECKLKVIHWRTWSVDSDNKEDNSLEQTGRLHSSDTLRTDSHEKYCIYIHNRNAVRLELHLIATLIANYKYLRLPCNTDGCTGYYNICEKKDLSGFFIGCSVPGSCDSLQPSKACGNKWFNDLDDLRFNTSFLRGNVIK